MLMPFSFDDPCSQAEVGSATAAGLRGSTGSGGGTAGGFRYGILIGLLGCGANIIQYAVQPLTTTILIAWCIGGIIEFAIAGAIVGAIYKPAIPRM